MGARLLGLIVLAAVPLLAMVAPIAWQNYRFVAERARQQAVTVLTAAAARNDAVLDQAAQVLSGLAAAPEVAAGGSVCADRLGGALELFAGRYRRLSLIGAGDRVRCAAGLPPARAAVVAALLNAVRHAAGFVVGGVSARPGEFPVAVVGAPIGGSPLVAAVLVAELRVDWLTIPGSSPAGGLRGSAWLVDRPPEAGAAGGATRLVAMSDPSVASRAVDAAPPPAVLAALLRPGATPRIVATRDGVPYAYDVARLRGGLTLLVAVPAAAHLARAEAVLIRRLAELGLLLLAGLAAVLFGARLMLVAPIAALSRAARVWRDGGPFEPGPLERAPAEIAALATSFQEATTALRERETELRVAARHQDLLMQEVHHRVKNNLQIVASLLNLQASRIRLPEARAEFHAARDRIRALATLHRHLYAYDDLQTINMRSFLAELCEQLLAAIGETPAGGRIRLDIDATDLRIASDQAVPIALIVTEAVGNAAQHAFPGGRSGHIRVRLRRLDPAEGATRALLEVEDDGVGMSAAPPQLEGGPRDGIGIQLIGAFARQLGAVLTVTHDGGTRYGLDIPLQPLPRGQETEPADA